MNVKIYLKKQEQQIIHNVDKIEKKMFQTIFRCKEGSDNYSIVSIDNKKIKSIIIDMKE